jgi:sugar/nucleoside kinase (ribokinase family)
MKIRCSGESKPPPSRLIRKVADAYRARIWRILPRADLVKASVEDLAFLVPGTSVPEAARVLLEGGARTVLVTDGPAMIRVFAGNDHLAVPVPPADVVDTVGAGDSFGGGFLAWWVERGLGRERLADAAQLRAAATASCETRTARQGPVPLPQPRSRLRALGYSCALRADPAPGPMQMAARRAQRWAASCAARSSWLR